MTVHRDFRVRRQPEQRDLKSTVPGFAEQCALNANKTVVHQAEVCDAIRILRHNVARIGDELGFGRLKPRFSTSRLRYVPPPKPSRLPAAQASPESREQ